MQDFMMISCDDKSGSLWIHMISDIGWDIVNRKGERATLFFFLILTDFYFFHYSWFTVFCQSSTVQQGDLVTYIYIIFLTLSSIMLHHRWLDIVPIAIQQDLMVYPFQVQYFASVNPRFPVHPTLSPSPLAATSLFSKSVSFFPMERFICAIY